MSRILEQSICPYCWRIRTPWHWLLRRLGYCWDSYL